MSEDNQAEVERNAAILQYLFQKRNETYKAITDKIISKFGPSTIEAIEEFLTKNNVKTSNSIIVWNDVHLVEDMIALAGVVRYASPGSSDTNKVDNNPFLVTVSDSERLFVVQIPFQLTSSGSKEEILTFLNQTANQGEMQNARIQAARHTALVDFDLDQLTEDQRRNLFFQAAPEKGNRGKN